jgi:hypothetical protein
MPKAQLHDLAVQVKLTNGNTVAAWPRPPRATHPSSFVPPVRPRISTVDILSLVLQAPTLLSLCPSMDPIVILSSIGHVYRYAVTARLTYPAWEVLTLHHLRQNYGSLRPKFGRLQSLVLITIFPDAEQILDRVEKHVLGTKTDVVMVLRKSTPEDCIMLAVDVCLEYQPVNPEEGLKVFIGR